MSTEKLREALHAKFRELGYTTNSQTSELLDAVFEALAAQQAEGGEAVPSIDAIRALNGREPTP